MSTPEKPRFSRADALAVARWLLPLQEACDPGKFMFVGSLRRKKETVGDIELLYVPRMVMEPDPEDLFGKKIAVNAFDATMKHLIQGGAIEKRLNVKGRESWGAENKLARHVESGLPIDFFQASFVNWHNLLVCRTGGAASNIAVCDGAIVKGWKWSPYTAGFIRKSPARGDERVELRPMHSEREVFDFAAVSFREPWERE